MWTIIHFIIRFLQDLWNAIKFAAVEYDDKLKLTKTPKQRILIWFMVGVFTIIGFIILIMFIRSALAVIHVTGI